jgi:tight adherence protein C
VPLNLILITVGVFVAAALAVGSITSLVLSSAATERRRLAETTRPGGGGVAIAALRPLAADAESVTGFWQQTAKVLPKSPKELSRLRKRLARAGFDHPSAPVLYSVAEILLPIGGAVACYKQLDPPAMWVFALAAAALMYMAPGYYVGQRLAARRREIEDGLPDALDLLVVCIEAGCGLDQAIVKTSDELAITYPRLSDEMRTLTMEIRAGKPRLDAFRSLADRTKVPDVKALVGTLIQTDKFGTSVGQALRTHANESRTKRRQRAEEAAQKIGVKLVFPLVLCFFPALYAVLLGPAVIQFMHEFMHK